MGEVWGNLSVPTDNTGDIPSADEIKNLIAFSNLVPNNHVKNGDLETWPNGASSAPAQWTEDGVGSLLQTAADKTHGSYAVQLTPGVSAKRLYQDLDAADVTYLQGKKVKLWAAVKTSTGSSARLTIDDGVGSSNSAFHNGDGTFQIIEVTHTVSASATRVRVVLEAGSAVAFFDEVVLVNFRSVQQWIPRIISDGGIRKDVYANRGTPSETEIFYATDTQQVFFYTTDPLVGDNGWVTLG